MDWLNNIIMLTDSYKVTQWDQYPPQTRRVASYFESRGGPWPTTFFGLQYFLKQYLCKPITKYDIEEAESYFTGHFGTSQYFNRGGWKYIVEKHHGHLPIAIDAVPEGTVVPQSNVLMTVTNLDPACYWLTNYLETLLVETWYPCTVASQSRAMREIILRYLEETGDPSTIDYRLHDFGFRGVSSPESAGLGGCAHLVNFRGTDTLAALAMARKFYGCHMAGNSVKASEHSTITSWREDGELDAFRNMLRTTPTGIVACVSDSFNIWRAITDYWGTSLRDEIMRRTGKLVVRPDSGDPVKVVPKCLDLLGERFPFTTNHKGYKVLDPHVGLIQGDGIKFDTIEAILAAVTAAGWSTDNLTFGSGGGLLQKLDRDVLKYAFKCSYVRIGDEDRDVYKNPITDSGKQSKRGLLKLVHVDGEYKTVQQSEPGTNLLQEVYRNGRLLVDHKLDDIRSRASL